MRSRGLRYLSSAVGLCALAFCTLQCGTIDVGDNFVAPDLFLDEDFFFCRVQPEVLTQYGCTGRAGEESSCHTSNSAMRLRPTTEPPPCNGDTVVAAVPADYRANLQAVSAFVQSDPLNSPLYVRPLGLVSHPERGGQPIFPGGENDPGAQLLFDWIAMGAQ